jgi:hypothetical protein
MQGYLRLVVFLQVSEEAVAEHAVAAEDQDTQG